MAQSNSDPSDRSAYFATLNIEDLEELLEIEMSNGGGFRQNKKTIDAITNAILEKERIKPTGRISNIEKAWSDFKYVYNVEDGNEEGLYPAVLVKNTRERTNGLLKRTFVTVAIVIILIVCALPPALGYGNFIQLLADWNDAVFSFNNSGNDKSQVLETNSGNQEQQYRDFQTALFANGITSISAPSWIPDDFVQKDISVLVYPDTGTTSVYAFYNNTNEQNIIINYTLHSSNNSNVIYEKDNNDVYIYNNNGIDYYIFENNGRFITAWTVDNIECSLQADIAKDTLIQIIKSISVT